MSVTIVFDATALAQYACLERGGPTVAEIITEVTDDPTATIAMPVLAVAAAYRRARGKDDDLDRLARLVDADLSPVARIPIGPDAGEVLGDLYGDLDDLPCAQAALVSIDHGMVPILTADGDRYRAAGLGLDILDL